MKHKNYRYHHTSHITRHTSHTPITHTSHITHHTSHITRHIIIKNIHKMHSKSPRQRAGTKRSNQITHRLEEDIFAMTVKFEC
jgi:hypothetical protein